MLIFTEENALALDANRGITGFLKNIKVWKFSQVDTNGPESFEVLEFMYIFSTIKFLLIICVFVSK